MEQRYYIAALALAVTLLILGAICMGMADKTDESSRKHCKNSAFGVLVISLILLVGAGFLMFRDYMRAGNKFQLYYY